MEMIIEEGILITDMIQKYKWERNTSKEFITCGVYTTRYALKERFTSIKKEASHGDVSCYFSERKCVMFLIQGKMGKKE